MNPSNAGKMKTKYLFLDRDGVLNVRPGTGYVRNPAEFNWISGSLESLSKLSQHFVRILVVTNQQGVGKGLMDQSQLDAVHKRMLGDVRQAGGRIDRIYAATGLRHRDSMNRKPAGGMALEAKSDYPEIEFDDSWMVGDTFRDMLFGYRLGMHTALIAPPADVPFDYLVASYRFATLWDFTNFILNRAH